MTTYILAGGCFWCLEAVFRRLRGVSKVRSGYAGGSAIDANYYRVASGATDHAESVEITFDESLLPSEVLLDIYFLIHDPTSLNRQGADVGLQYRSAMFYADEEQKQLFQEAIARAQSQWEAPIVTRLEPLERFYEAEPEHHNYFENNPANPYCSIVISPKIAKARQAYSQYVVQ